MKHLLKLICPCILLCAASCKKESLPTIVPPAIVTVKVSDELKAWAYFKQGSYWIYKDTTTAAPDSAFITSIVSHTLNETRNDTLFRYETITINYSSGRSAETLCSYRGDRLTINEYSWPGYYDFTIFKPSGGKVISSMTVQGQAYNDVRYIYNKIEIDQHLQSGSLLTYTGYGYWKKNIGRIKEEQIFNGVNNTLPMELLRYHVEQ